MTYVDRAVILAAGLGTRLAWMGSDQPKALVRIAGEPLVVHVIRHLVRQGIHDIAINVHHHADKLMQALGDGSRFGARLYYSREDVLLDSGGGVRTALSLLPGSGLFAVHNADVLADVDLQSLTRHVPDRGGCLALVPNPYHHPDGDFVLQGDLVRKQGPGERYTYAGVSVWHEDAFALFQPHVPFPLSQLMNRLASMRMLTGVVHQGFWIDAGRPADILRARRMMATRWQR